MTFITLIICLVALGAFPLGVVTRISDIIEPAAWSDYVIELSSTKSRLIQSGLVAQDNNLNGQIGTGGRSINMPFWQDLSGADEVLSDTGSLTAGAITTAQDIAVILRRGRAFGENDLAVALSGDDPGAAIAARNILIADHGLMDARRRA